jgi:DNA-directed RNA polymerase sigma subunit (sigma70/sigma32)
MAKLRVTGKFESGGALGSQVYNAYIVEILCPKIGETCISTKKLSVLQQEEIIKNLSKNSLRELGRKFNVSYETVRRIRKISEGMFTS